MKSRRLRVSRLSGSRGGGTMPMRYARVAIAAADVPRAAVPLLQHALDTYASETNKVATVGSAFGHADLELRRHPRASRVAEIVRHQLLSERRFFGEFLGAPEPSPDDVVPPTLTIAAATDRL